MPQARKDATAGGVEDKGVDGEKKRRGESTGSLIALTTGVFLIPCFVGSDEEMRKRVSPPLLLLLLLLLRPRVAAYSLDFSLF